MNGYILIVLGVLSTWLLCAGWLFAHLRKQFALLDWKEDLGFAVLIGLCMGLMGPIGIFVTLCLTGFANQGWRLWNKNR